VRRRRKETGAGKSGRILTNFPRDVSQGRNPRVLREVIFLDIGEGLTDKLRMSDETSRPVRINEEGVGASERARR
jgi:hypothetical protein